MKPLRILALEAYYGGSHKAFLDTWIRHSGHEWTLHGMPARHWKWRMRGSAMWFAEQVGDVPAGRFDLVFTSDMTSVTDLRALLPPSLRGLPLICYFHENQLTYPLSPQDWRDYQYGFTNITSALASDAAWFNSHAHRTAFLAAARDLLRGMSDFVPQAGGARLARMCTVHYPAVEDPGTAPGAKRRDGPVRILWCHRWEYDKNPEAFFQALVRLHDAGKAFELVLLGEQFRSAPPSFAEARDKLAGHIVHAEYLESVEAYRQRIASCDVVVSTAIQENFGIAIIEAVVAGCHPLLPDRLSYPELVPPTFRARHLYATDETLHARLAELCDDPISARGGELGDLRGDWRRRFGAAEQVPRLDRALSDVVSGVNLRMQG